MLIDVAGTELQVGWFVSDQIPTWVSIEAEAGTGLYRAIEQLAISPNCARAFIFCEGPGSILGIRTIAAALRTWTALNPRPIFAYRSLELAAAQLGTPGATLIADARRQSWHTLTLDDQGGSGQIKRLPTDELPPGPIYTLAGMRSWTPLPHPLPPALPYDAAKLTTDLAEVPLLRETAAPDAFQPERPTFAKWTPKVHQGPIAP